MESACEFMDSCPFFSDKIGRYPVAAGAMRAKYCLGDNADCARYRVAKALGREAVPSWLFPNDVDRALKLLAAV
jgi:hypothetical protein